MSLSREMPRRQRRFGPIRTAVALAIGATMLSACSFAPVYGDRAVANVQHRLAYASPNSRLEQVIYQELRLKLGNATAFDAPTVTISVKSSSRKVGLSDTALPTTTREAVLEASIEMAGPTADEPEILFKGTRSAAASYTTNGQILADRQALQNAEERAAKQLADIVRLTLIGVLAKQDLPSGQ